MRQLKVATGLVVVMIMIAIAPLSCSPDGRNHTKVVVLGFDGASWDTIDPLIEAGKLPVLARLKQDAAWGRLATFKPTKSPVIWTSIATGKSMTKHGILDFVFMEKNDIQVPYSNSERREPAIWQILDHFDRRSVVVNWFVTYPPDAIDGVMVSNRFRKTLLLPEERRARMVDSVHPPQYFNTLQSFVSLDYDDIRRARELPDIAALHKSLAESNDATQIPVLKDYWIYVLQEALTENVSRYLYETEDYDLFAAYFRLPDIVSHVALTLIETDDVDTTLEKLRRGELTESERRLFQKRLASVLEPFYRYMESIINAYARTLPNDTYLIVVSDHGFTLHGGGYDHYHIPEATEAPAGIFLMMGPDVVAGRMSSVSVYDIAPTILHLFALPVGEMMDGEPLTTALGFERAVHQQRYARELMTPKEHRRDREIDERTLEELRSLGYIH